MLSGFLWRYRWARRCRGGRWERWGERWVPVAEWSTPRDRPEEYGRGRVPDREEWPETRKPRS